MAKQAQVTVGAVILHGHRIFLIQRAGEPGKGLWSVPGGKLEFGESLTSAVEREAKEETGMHCTAHRLYFYWEYRDPDYHYVILDFLCTTDDRTFSVSSDALLGNWFTLHQAGSLALAPGMPELLQAIEKDGLIEDNE